MMNLSKCLQSASDQGAISRAEAEDLAERFDHYRKQRQRQSGADAELLAKADVAAELRANAAEKKRRTALQALAQQRVDGNLEAYTTANGEKDVGGAALAILESRGRGSPYSSVETSRKAIIGMAHGKLAELLETFHRTKLTGATPNTARLENVVREAFGENTGDTVAKGLAQSWASVAEELRSRFNRAGGAIGKLENWGMPQSHNALALVKRGREAWKADITPLLDMDRMRNGLTDLPMTPADLDAALDGVYDNIVTQGWASREAQMRRTGRGPISGQHAEQRFLVFKDASTWLLYQRAYGEGDPFATMMGHVNVMARDIAAMEQLGPNAEGMISYLEQRILKNEAQKRGGLPSDYKGFGGQAQHLQNVWQIMRGGAEAPVNKTLAYWGAAARNLITSTAMGSAIISALPSDPMFQMMARQMNGLPVMKALPSIIRSFRSESREVAVRSGLILDSAMHTFGEQARYAGTLGGPQWSRYISDRVLTLSGLTPWTQSMRHAFGLDFFSALADLSGKGFDGLPAEMQKSFKHYGITPENWDVMRKAELHVPGEGSAPLLRPTEIAKVDERLAERLLEMVLTETEFAVPSGGVRDRAAIIGNTRAGTLSGEFLRSFGMFKSFGVFMALGYGGRMWRETVMSPARGAAYAGALFTTLTLTGAMAMWMKDVINGKDPRPIGKSPADMAKFWGAAALQGGGLGIFGDFFFADVNRFGGGFASTLGGPVADRAFDVTKLTVGNLIQLGTGEETDFAQEAADFSSRNVPGNNIWYLRLAYQRVVIDQLQHMTDPNANKAFKRRQQKLKQDMGNDMWWRPGEVMPDRVPRI